MDRYIGIDVHAQSCTIVAKSAKGRRLREQVVETHGEALSRWANPHDSLSCPPTCLVVARLDERGGSSDGGAILLRAIDLGLGLTKRLAGCLSDL